MLMQTKTPKWIADAMNQAKRGPHAIIADITPADANFLLNANDGNRYLRPAQVKQYASDMAAGRWQLNGQSIVIADSGELNDGQHRLAAQVDADFTLKTVVVFGVPRDSRVTLDSGVHRNASDYLHIAHGTPNATTAASIARAVIAFERSKRLSFEGTKWVTMTEIVERVLKDRDMAEAAQCGHRFAGPKDGRLASPSAYGICYYLLAKISHPAADRYLFTIANAGGARSDAAMAVRQELMRTTSRRRESHIAMILKGWNYARAKVTPPDGALAPTYPLPKLAI